MFGLRRVNSRSPGSACRKVCTATFGKIGDKINVDHADGKTLVQVQLNGEIIAKKIIRQR